MRRIEILAEVPVRRGSGAGRGQASGGARLAGVRQGRVGGSERGVQRRHREAAAAIRRLPDDAHPSTVAAAYRRRSAARAAWQQAEEVFPSPPEAD